MRDTLAPRDRRLANRLTTIKLALQMLDRKTELSAYQRDLVRSALEATDGLTVELLEQLAERKGMGPGTLPIEWGVLAATAGMRSQ